MKQETGNLTNKKGIIDGPSCRGRQKKLGSIAHTGGARRRAPFKCSEFKPQITMETFLRRGNWGGETMLHVRSLKHAQQRIGSV